MEYRILGPLEVVEDGTALDLGPRKQRSLLALLLITANRVVSTDRILEELWGEEAEGKENALWVYVSRLRSVLEPERDEPTILITRDHGYSLAVEPETVDAFRFESAAASGRSTMRDDPDAAAETLSEALSLWRGDVLEGFRYDEFAQAEIHRLEELRTTALEDRIEADLRRGESNELIAELDALSEAHPLRERPVSLKMLALYRAGRQAEALRTYERFRRTLGDEMGIDPSPELHRLEEQVLLHDSRLQARMPRRSTAAVDTESATNPFKGLQAFHEADADDFFGRDRVVAEVVRRIGGGEQLVTLVGPSGSGKSSVVRAGVIPTLRKDAIPGSDGWLIAQMVPGAHPFAELEAALLRSTIDAPDSLTDQLQGDESGILRAVLRVLPEDTSKLLIVIDQFEELFTLVEDETTRGRFLDGLTEAVRDPHGRVMVLLTLRADFYDRPLQYPVFGARMGDAIVNVVPMTPDELERAANEPAARARVTLEPSLLASLLTDVVGQPGALPLFQYTLTRLFERRSGAILDLEDYEKMGGLRGTLSRRADDIFSKLTDDQQAAGRQLFLRLVTIADTDEWSRRRVLASEIVSLDVDVVDLQGVIEAYGGARLLTFDRDQVSGSPTVEVAHEALLTEWDRLRGWIDAAREDVRRQASLATAATEWRSSDENADYLLTGSRLAKFEAWAGTTTLALSGGERTYLGASVAERQAIETAEEERVARETALGRRASRRLWGMAATLGVLLSIGLFFAISALLPKGPTVVLFSGPDMRDDAFRLGFNQAAADLSIEARIEETVVDPASDLRVLAEEAPDLVILSPYLLDWYSIEAVADDYPDVRFVALQSGFVGPANVSSPQINEAGGSYLMGVAAAEKTENAVVGLVGAAQIPSLAGFVAGFEAGVKDTDPAVDVLVAWMGPEDYGETGFSDGPFDDPESARAAATELIEAGADVVYQVAGRSGAGVTEAIVEQSTALGSPIWSLGVDIDQYAGASEAERAVLLTSLIKRDDLMVYEVIESYLSEEFTPGLVDLDLSTGHVGFSELGTQVTDLVSQLEATKLDIVNGAIQVPDHVDFVPGWWPEPDVAVDVVFVGDRCVIEGEPVAGPKDRVSIHFRNESDGGAGVGIWVDDSGITAADLGPNVSKLLLERAGLASAWEVSSGGTTEIQARATRDRMIVNCWSELTDEDFPAGIIPVTS